MRFLFSLLLISLSWEIFSQDSLHREKNIYLFISGGIPVIGENNFEINNYKFESTNPFFAKLSVNYIFRNGLGVYGSIKRIAYRFPFSRNSLLVNNPDFAILNANNFLEYLGDIYSAGISYKIKFKKVLIFPNLSIGIRDFNNVYGGVILKKNNSNIIRSITNLSTINDHKISPSFGFDLSYCFSDDFGITVVFDYDNFDPRLHSLLAIKDYLNEFSLENNFNLNQQKIILAFGFFIRI